MPKLAELNLCTGCGACAYKCPKSCITMQENEIGIIYPRINHTDCIGCHVCENICPVLNNVEYHKPISCYSAWNSDSIERNSSASGGVAAAVYKDLFSKGYSVVGALQRSDWRVVHKIASNSSDVKLFKNSKYAFSEAYDVYGQMEKLLKANKNVVFIGLPCQVAAMRKLFGKYTTLLLIDVVCHGNTPVRYLVEHINSLENLYKKKANRMSFRAPEKGTANYYFTLYDGEGNIFYSRRSVDGDTYNIAFHRAISYRENCYSCLYARSERVSDITLGDYHGLGKLKPCSYSENKVSVVLVNTDTGKNYINSLLNQSNLITAEERPIEEPILGDSQLRHPSLKTRARLDFEKYIYTEKGHFENAMRKVIRNTRIRDMISKCKQIIKRSVAKFK